MAYDVSYFDPANRGVDPNKPLDLSATSDLWGPLWGTVFDPTPQNIANFSPENARAYFTNPANSRNLARGLINLGFSESAASQIPRALGENNFSPDVISLAQQNVTDLNSRQHNEGSDFDLGPMLAFAAITGGLGGFAGLGSMFGGLETGAGEMFGMTGLEGVVAPSSLSFTGSIGGTPDWLNRLNYGNSEWSNLVDQVGSNLTGGTTNMANGAGTADWWDFGPGEANNWNDIIENQGNVTGGGALGGDQTWGQLGIPQEIGSKVDQLLKSGISPKTLAQLFGGTTGDGSYQFPFGKVLGGLLESYGQKQYSNDLMGYLNKSLDYADPFHSQRPGYQTQFRNLTQNPSNFFSDPAIKSAIDFEDQATSRKLASQGYNMSGNFANEVASTRMREAFKNYIPYADMIGTAAGYKFGPGASGEIAAKQGTAIAGSNQAALGGLGSAVGSAMQGEQPSYLDQIFGKQPNQNLAQLFMQGLS